MKILLADFMGQDVQSGPIGIGHVTHQPGYPTIKATTKYPEAHDDAPEMDDNGLIYPEVGEHSTEDVEVRNLFAQRVKEMVEAAGGKYHMPPDLDTPPPKYLVAAVRRLERAMPVIHAAVARSERREFGILALNQLLAEGDTRVVHKGSQRITLGQLEGLLDKTAGSISGSSDRDVEFAELTKGVQELNDLYKKALQIHRKYRKGGSVSGSTSGSTSGEPSGSASGQHRTRTDHPGSGTQSAARRAGISSDTYDKIGQLLRSIRMRRHGTGSVSGSISGDASSMSGDTGSQSGEISKSIVLRALAGHQQDALKLMGRR
jgi:hypothetical protein